MPRCARPSLRCQPFAKASASASRGSSAASRASARSRSRSVGADSIGHVRRASGRLVVWRRTSSGVEELAHRLPERARLARRAVIGRRLAHEREQLPRSRARGVEEIAVAARRVGSLEARAPRGVELTARLVVEERRRRSAARQRSLLEADHEDRLEASRAGAREVEHRDTTRLAGCIAADRRPVERREHVVRRGPRPRPRAAARARRGSALAASAARRSRFAAGVDGWGAEAVRVAEHREHHGPRGGERRRPRRRAARASAAGARCAASSSPRPCGRRGARRGRAAGPRGSRRRRGRGRRTACGGRRRARGGCRCSRRSGAARAAPARTRSTPSRGRASIATGTPSAPKAVSIDARERSSDGQTIAISSGASAVADELEHGLGDELERGTAAGSLEEANRAVERGRRGAVVEEVALEVSEPGRQVGVGAGAELDDVAAGERGEVVDRPRERGERRAARLVRERHVHLAAGRKRLDQAPLRARQILEAVGEDRSAVPGAELASSAARPRGGAPCRDRGRQPLQLGAVGTRQLAPARARDRRGRGGSPRSR